MTNIGCDQESSGIISAIVITWEMSSGGTKGIMGHSPVRGVKHNKNQPFSAILFGFYPPPHILTPPPQKKKKLVPLLEISPWVKWEYPCVM